ncbi:MAG: methionine aminopeptidase [Dermatophilaceae bacterium]
MAFWYNVTTGAVEDDANRGQDSEVMGPYDTADEASRAIEIAAERTKAWDEEDRRWEEGED